VGPRTGIGNVEKKKFLTLPGLELRLRQVNRKEFMHLKWGRNEKK
jgi:hypothetical protein